MLDEGLSPGVLDKDSSQEVDALERMLKAGSKQVPGLARWKVIRLFDLWE